MLTPPGPDRFDELRQAQLRRERARLLQEQHDNNKAAPASAEGEEVERAPVIGPAKDYAMSLPPSLAPFIALTHARNIQGLRDEDLATAHIWLHRYLEAADREITRRRAQYVVSWMEGAKPHADEK